MAPPKRKELRHNLINNEDYNMTIKTMNNCDDLRLITIALFYLSKEAEQSGLDQVSKIIQTAISRINDWSIDNKAQLSDVLINKDTIHTMEFLSRFADFSEEERNGIIKIIASLNDEGRESEDIKLAV